MSQNISIRFPDLVQREDQQRAELLQARARLEKRKDTLPPAERRNFDRINAIFERVKRAPALERADPLYVSLRHVFNTADGLFTKTKQLANDDQGQLRLAKGDLSFEDVAKISLVLGLLAVDGAKPPRLVHTPTKGKAGDIEIHPDTEDPRYEEFSRAVYAAVGEANASRELAEVVLSRLEEEGDPDADDRKAGQVKSEEFARVVRCLRNKGIRGTDRPVQLRRAINECLDDIQQVGTKQPLSKTNIALPLFNTETLSDLVIIPDNVRLCAVPVCVTMFDSLKVFDVVDKLVEMAQDGTLTVNRGDAADMLYDYWKQTPLRISAAERKRFVAQTIGVPGGEVRGPVNKECNDLWTRFVSSVAELVRQHTADKLLRATLPSGVRQQQVRKAARDLARNLSAHTYGMAHNFAAELLNQINGVIALLNHPDIRAQFGAKNLWQVVDQVATLELGGAQDSSRYSTLASCGAIITAWLANNVNRYSSATSEPIIRLHEVMSDDPPTAGEDARSTPTDYDLVNACELWAMDMALGEQEISKQAEPRLSPAGTSRPVQIPSIARELLEQSDLSGLGLGLRH